MRRGLVGFALMIALSMGACGGTSTTNEPVVKTDARAGDGGTVTSGDGGTVLGGADAGVRDAGTAGTDGGY